MLNDDPTTSDVTKGAASGSTATGAEMSSGPSPADESPESLRRVAVASFIGTAIEFPLAGLRQRELVATRSVAVSRGGGRR